MDLNEQFRAQASDEIAHEIWSEENVRELLEEISSLASQHISKVRTWWATLDTTLTMYVKSHEVWDPWIHWELERLEELATLAETDPMKLVEKEQAAIRIDEMFLSRLKQPHSSTPSSAYQSFAC